MLTNVDGVYTAPPGRLSTLGATPKLISSFNPVTFLFLIPRRALSIAAPETPRRTRGLWRRPRAGASRDPSRLGAFDSEGGGCWKVPQVSAP